MKFPFYPLIVASIYLTLSSAQCETQEPASYQAQQQRLKQAIQQQPIHGHARNIVLFIGDGMGISTITAARILEGQQNGNSGEENNLSWESFPNTALIKVYNSNQQTPDSAGTMSAIMTGHKTKAYTFGYDQDVVRGDHTSVEDYEGASRKVTTLLERFEKEGKSTGIVTTARITHATPAACYAHSPERNWEHDADMKSKHKNAYEAGFKDIARQLIEFPHGDGLEVALGGGRRAFIPETSPDHEDPTNFGKRLDGRNLINEWLIQPQSSFVYDHAGLDAVDTNQTSKLLGLFEPAHMQYEVDRAKPIYPDEPSLEQMSIKALEVLRKNEKGFFLMIEAGRIDHAHHAGNAHRALMETIRLSDAVRGIRESLTKQEKKETLILVTADHSHTFTIAGYPTRGNPILGLVVGNDSKGQPEKEPKKDALGLPYTTLGYVNGGGYTGSVLNKKSDSVSHGGTHFHGKFGDGGGSLVAGNDWKYINVPRQSRPDLSEVDVECENYVQEAGIPMGSETHGGEDVVAYAEGPMAHLISGVHEQNFIFHVMRFASDASQFDD
jgi:alkaline phosphatase